MKGDKRNKREYERRKATEEETKPQRRKDETEKQKGREKPSVEPGSSVARWQVFKNTWFEIVII